MKLVRMNAIRALTSSKANFLFRSSFKVSSSTILEIAALRMSGVWRLDSSPVALDFLSVFRSQMVGLDTALLGGDAISSENTSRVLWSG
jgi:hypothetical protein